MNSKPTFGIHMIFSFLTKFIKAFDLDLTATALFLSFARPNLVTYFQNCPNKKFFILPLSREDGNLFVHVGIQVQSGRCKV